MSTIPDSELARLRSALYAFVRRRVRNEADAEDIVQRSLLKLEQHRNRLRDATLIDGWTFRTARNAVIDYYRARARRVMVPLDSDADTAAVATDRSSASAAGALEVCVRPLIDTLPAADQSALRLIDLEGQAQTDTARTLGLSVSGMKSRVQRARHRLRAAMDTCCDIQRGVRGDIIAYEKRTGACVCAARCACADSSPAGVRP
jgi:RNA polymerase sigma-70 factor (ECF subfamily)